MVEKSTRLYSLDYLRGVAALGIMIYHYLMWLHGDFDADTFIGRVGIYGVGIFYVLSGLTLYHVYYYKMNPTKSEVTSFFKKRIYRIFPLLWLATIVSIILSGEKPDKITLLLNLTGLFGFIQWDKYFSTGVWSIGNELVFYVFFPFFILFMKKYKSLMILLSLIIFWFFIYFSFYKLMPEIKLSNQWRDYVNPLNQVFLFLGGFLIGYFGNKMRFNNIYSSLLVIIGLVIFTYYPTTGDSINLITGINRILYTICCFSICLGFYILKFDLPLFIHKPFTLLGEASYSVYLLHPIIWKITDILMNKINMLYSIELFEYRLIVSILITLVASYITYQYFERFFMNLSHKK
ncbi:acyltransferase family protein [Elizabethkingia meningoseptica]